MKPIEDNNALWARLDAERDRLVALLKEWPSDRRVVDQKGYTDALKAWHAECQGEE